MLMQMRVKTDVARAICLDCAVSLDMARAVGGDWGARAAFLTPIAKAFGTDTGNEVANLGVQVHGGMGFIEETGAAQYARDVRVTSIYEGTNGIQAMDLVGRKLSDGGAAACALLDAMAPGPAVDAVRAATQTLAGSDMLDRSAGAVAYLRAFAIVLGAHYPARAAVADAARAPMARFWDRVMVSQVAGLCESATGGAEDLYAIPAEALSA